jgi:hypothetical protein
MAGDGRWVVGRIDARPCFHEPGCQDGGHVTWEALQRDAEPATVTHTYTGTAPAHRWVLGGDGKPLMSMGGLGSAPAPVLHWGASAWCIACTWSTHDTTEDVVRAYARWHRRNPELFEGHATPRHRFTPVAAAAPQPR